MKKILLAISCLFILLYSKTQPINLLVGTYTNHSNSKGIYVYQFNQNTGRITLKTVTPASNPSYLAVSKNKKYVYAVNENSDSLLPNKSGTVSSFKFNANTSTLTYINKQSTQGAYPCYVNIHASNQWLVVGNYGGGNFAVLPIALTGELGKATSVIQHYGKGANNNRQEAPHVHCTVFNENDICVADLGTDKLYQYKLSQTTGNIDTTQTLTTTVNAGSGPRHFTIASNKQYGYLMQELSGEVLVLQQKNKAWQAIQNISSLPTNYKGSIGAADIHISPNGKFLYCSHRGESNIIAIFKISRQGTLSSVGFQSTYGISPRNFCISPNGKFLLVANQLSNNIVVFSINEKTGDLTHSGITTTVPKPVCLQFID